MDSKSVCRANGDAANPHAINTLLETGHWSFYTFCIKLMLKEPGTTSLVFAVLTFHLSPLNTRSYL